VNSSKSLTNKKKLPLQCCHEMTYKTDRWRDHSCQINRQFAVKIHRLFFGESLDSISCMRKKFEENTTMKDGIRRFYRMNTIVIQPYFVSFSLVISQGSKLLTKNGSTRLISLIFRKRSKERKLMKLI
jgi:hypothetical protein